MPDEEKRKELPTKYQNNILRDHTLFQLQFKQEVFDKQEPWFFAIRTEVLSSNFVIRSAWKIT